ncbi:MAG TPA: glycosyltransferase family 1 protein [Acidobacteriota bacterium]|nr:glycosyltransferase family 1 protein [Acidobacteriota bacterium]
MRVAIDARKINDYGIGSYLRGLIGASAQIRPDWRFVLIGEPSDAHELDQHTNISWIVNSSRKYGLGELISLPRAVRSTRADVFHSPHYVVPPRLPCPAVVTVHDCIHLRFREHLPRPLGFLPRSLSYVYARAMMGHAVAHASRVIAVSESTGQDLIARLGVPSDRLRVVLNGANEFWHRPTPAPRAEVIARQLDLPQQYLLWVGNPKPHKNLERLVCAFERLAPARPDLHLLLAGAQPGQVEGLTRPRINPERCHALGEISNEALRLLYERAAALVIPSLWEGFGLPALEAMAAGAPVVAAAVGGVQEVVGDAGVLVDPSETDSIAAGIRRLLDEPELGEKLRQRGRERAAELTWHRAAEATLHAYSEAAESTP